MSVGDRLRAERLRLRITQPAFGALAGVSKGAIIKWEKGASSPNADALIGFHGAGADVLYILTGQRAPSVLNTQSGSDQAVHRSPDAFGDDRSDGAEKPIWVDHLKLAVSYRASAEEHSIHENHEAAVAFMELESRYLWKAIKMLKPTVQS